MHRYLAGIAFVLSMQAHAAAAPDWAVAQMANTVGVWLADNSAYRSEAELADQYGIEWTRPVPGAPAITGVLFSVVDGERTYSHWAFFQFWDPARDELRVIQVGGNGIVGEGSLTREGKASELVQVFTLPDGSSNRRGHRTIHAEGRHQSASFTIDDDNQWIPGREYVWIRQASD